MFGVPRAFLSASFLGLLTPCESENISWCSISALRANLHCLQLGVPDFADLASTSSVL